MKKFLLNLQFIFKPSYWIMNNPYNKKLDLFMNQLMDSYQFKKHPYSDCTAFIGGVKIWVENHPYASFIPYDDRFQNVRPSRLTIKRGMEKLNNDLYGGKTSEEAAREKFYKEIELLINP